MKKVGIVTWFESENYGTALQAFALDDVLKRNGYAPYVIASFTYNHFGIVAVIRRIFDSIGLLLYLRSHFVRCVNRKRKIKIYNFFKDHSSVIRVNSKSHYNKLISEIPVFITGSDQIWNPNFLETFYLLDFAKNNKRIAYSSSIGVSEIPIELKSLYKDCLGKFEKIGLREDRAVSIVNELLETDKAIKVVDPTLLVSKEGWYDLISKSQLCIQDKYILCYLIGNRKEYSEYVASIQRFIGIKRIIVITSAENDSIHLEGVEADYFHDAGLEDFAYLINNSEFICTDSFHATAISIKLEKDFVEFMRFADSDPQSQNSRITDILARYRLADRIYIGENSIRSQHIDYSECNRVLNYDIQESMRFLLESIG